MENSFYNMKMQKTGYIRTHFITLLGVSIASSLVPSVFEKIISLEIVENDICLGSTSKQMPFFQKNVPLKKRTHALSGWNRPCKLTSFARY